MTRTARNLSTLAGAIIVLVLAAGVVVWHVSPSRKPVPPLHFMNAAGRKLTMADFRGRVVLLNLWATWCVPCRKEMPALDRLEAKLGGPDFAVVPLSIDRQGLAAVQPFYRQLGLKALHIYLDPSGDAAFAVGAPGVPTTLLVDRDGRELGRVIGAAKWDGPAAEAMVQRYLGRQAAGTGRPPSVEPIRNMR